MKSLEQHLKDYYEAQSLSALEVEVELPSRRGLLLSALGSLAIALTGAVLMQSRIEQDSLGDLALAEIARNHRANYAPDAQGTDIRALRSAMPKLAFALGLPQAWPSGLLLIGSRYCSIQGELAVQIKVRELGSTEAHTLFVAKASPRLKAIGEGHALARDVAIRYWREHDLFFAFAANQASSDILRKFSG
jgi:hypothetical protein